MALKVSKNLKENSPQMSHFIGLQKLAVGPPGRPANDHISDRYAIGRPVGRPRPGYREQVSLSGRPLGRPGRSTTAPTVRKMTVGGRPGGRPAVLSDPNGQFFQLYKLGHLGAVFSKISRRVLGQFFPLISVVISTSFRANISNQKESFYQEC